MSPDRVYLIFSPPGFDATSNYKFVYFERFDKKDFSSCSFYIVVGHYPKIIRPISPGRCVFSLEKIVDLTNRTLLGVFHAAESDKMGLRIFCVTLQ